MRVGDISWTGVKWKIYVCISEVFYMCSYSYTSFSICVHSHMFGILDHLGSLSGGEVAYILGVDVR